MGMLDENSGFLIVISFFRQTLAQGLGDPITGLYATNASAPLQEEAGIRQVYKFGLYSYCGYLNNTAGICTNTTVANKYQPYDALLADMASNYSALTIYIINGTSSFENQSIASHTRSAYYLILVGTICAFLALVMCAVSRSCLYRFYCSQLLLQWRFQAYLSFPRIRLPCSHRNCLRLDGRFTLDFCHQQFGVCEWIDSEYDRYSLRDRGLKRLWLVSLMGRSGLLICFSYSIFDQVRFLAMLYVREAAQCAHFYSCCTFRG